MPLRVAVSVLFIPAFVLVGCMVPPKVEKAAAEEAVNGARAAGAEQYAPGDFAAAGGTLRDAAARTDARKYDEAKALYEKARSLGNRAAEVATRGKATLRASVEQQLADAQKRWRELEGRLKAATTRLQPERRQAVAADRKTVIETLQLVGNLAGDDPLAARDSLVAATATLDRWEAELKATNGLAKNP